MKTTFLVTTQLEIEHDEFTNIDNVAITEAANAGAQKMATEMNIMNAVVGTRSRSPKRVIATPTNVVTCADGHKHDLRLPPWSNKFVQPEQCVGEDL